MPGMSGFELQGLLAQRAQRIPVVVLTGQDTPERFARANAGGASAYLRRPVDSDALLAAELASCARR